ncbi:hypothetical protein L3Q82_009862, partial [Scortum barcoo]
MEQIWRGFLRSLEMDDQLNPLERDHSLSVVLPGGVEKHATVHGSKPVMDLLVTLCASYHLNPSDYTVELLSPNKNNISLKPNSPIGSLEVEKIVLKPKGMEEKIKRPYMPESAPRDAAAGGVRQVREFNIETTILLRDSQSKEPLDLTKTLNEHGLREVLAKDTAAKEPLDRQRQPQTPEAAVTPTEVISPPPPQDLPKKKKKQKENMGFLSLFRRKKKKPEMEGAVSAPISPGLKDVGAGMKAQGVSSSCTLPADVPKKRRAPQPPMGASHSVPNNLSTCHVRGPQRSAESTLRSTKRRAPPPPRANSHQELQADTEVKGKIFGDYSNRWAAGSQLESVLRSDLPTESEWEDPAQKKGMTTFKVVPSKKQKSHNPELTLDVPDQRTVEEVSPEVENNPTEPEEPEEDLRSPSRSETQTPLSPEPFSQEIEAADRPASAPHPLDLDSQDCPGSPLSEVRDTAEKQEEVEEPEITSEEIQAEPSDCIDEELQSDGPVDSEDWGECPQSPSGKSVSTDMGHCGLYTEEKEVEEELVQEEQEEKEENNFPPPPPPVFFNEDTEVMEEGREESLPSSPPSPQPKSPTSNGQTIAISEDHQNEPTSPTPHQPTAAPTPPDKISAAPSRFAQAVALAVQRSRLQSRGKGSGPQDPGDPHSTLPSPPRSTYQY